MSSRRRSLNYGGIFDIDRKEREIAEFEAQSQGPTFWDDNLAAQKVMREIAMRKEWVEEWGAARAQADDIAALVELGREAGDDSMTPELEAAQVSPHFTLGQFVCKEPGNPRYVVLREPLLVKLENLLAAVNARGIQAYTFAVMSAYRTPVYNSAIGNVTTFSRHRYGDAADIYVDNDGDGRMDDLNHDGRHTQADAKVLGAIVNATQDEGEFAGLTGGLGMYAPTEEHGPFVHVDVRGFPARWGS